MVTWTILDNHFHLVLHVPDKETAPEFSEEAFWERLGALYTKEQVVDIQARIAGIHRANPGLAGIALEKGYRDGFCKRMHDLSEFMKTLLQTLLSVVQQAPQPGGPTLGTAFLKVSSSKAVGIR